MSVSDIKVTTPEDAEDFSVEPPREVVDYLLREFGKNPHGQPMVRCIWGAKRMEWACLPFEDRPQGPRILYHEDGTTSFDKGTLLSRKLEARRIFTYPLTDRFYVEYWMPPSMSREKWEKLTHQTIDGQLVETLGPYPSEGDYHYVATINVRPTVRMVEDITAGLKIRLSETPDEITARVNAAHEKKELERRLKRVEILRENRRPWTGPAVSLAGIDVPGRTA